MPGSESSFTAPATLKTAFANISVQSSRPTARDFSCSNRRTQARRWW